MDWPNFAKRLLLADGHISAKETALLGRAILAGGTINREEVEFLVELKRAATTVAPSFDRLLYAVLKRVVLRDGSVSDPEAGWLEKAVFDGKLLVTDQTLRFLRTVRDEATTIGPKFQKLCAKWIPVEAKGAPVAKPVAPVAKRAKRS